MQPRIIWVVDTELHQHQVGRIRADDATKKLCLIVRIVAADAEVQNLDSLASPLEVRHSGRGLLQTRDKSVFERDTTTKRQRVSENSDAKYIRRLGMFWIPVAEPVASYAILDPPRQIARYRARHQVAEPRRFLHNPVQTPK